MSDWLPPTELPDLRRVGIVALDTETLDNGLRAGRGSAWPWRDGHIAGISVAYRAEGSIRAHYFPLRHPDSDNFDPARVFDWLKDLVASDVRFVTQNGIYDWGWLGADGNVQMPPADRLEEILAVATLVDENRFRYSLDALAAWRGLPGKDLTLLQQAIAASGLVPKRKKKTNVQEYIWQLPARFVGPYAKADAVSTLALWENLNPVLDKEGTRAAYRLEVDLLPMVLAMRRRGIRIDVAAAEHGRDLLLQKRDATFAELAEQLDASVGMEEIASPKWKARTFNNHNIAYPRTAKGNPSFKAGKSGWMDTHPHWLPRLIAKANKYDAAAGKFLAGHILEHIVNGRIHAEIHPHRSDDGGARSLRFSYSSPPLQQMPARDKELAPLIRGVFLPEDGEVWAKPDISQQEFRFVVHHAALRGLPRAKEAAELYRTDPDADFHAMVAEMTGLERDAAKAVNFAKIFGAGVRKFAEMIGKPLHEAQAIYTQYDQKLPFISRLSASCQSDAKRLGYTVLYDGARRHWDYREVRGVYAKGAGPCPLEEAKRRINDPDHPWFGHWLQRANIHTAMNALIQGSAARHTKLWMRACWREGITPLLQMHDALDCSVTTQEQGELVARLACEAVALEVPMRVDLKFGKTWGDAKHTWAELHGMAAVPRPIVFDSAATPNGTAHPDIPELVAAPAIELPPEPQITLFDLIEEPLADGKICCPFHDDYLPSLHVYDDHFHCFGCGAHGNIVDWLMMAEGLSHDEAIDLLESWKGQAVSPARVQARADDEAKRARALELWGAAKPIADTLAAGYLSEHRRIDLTALPTTIGDVLRFHPRCPFGPGRRHPCLLALMRDIATDAPTGIQRIALAPDASKIDRRMLGRAGAVKLWPAGVQLVVGEGAETTLAAATRIRYDGVLLQPAWAVLSAGALSRFPIVAGVERLIILADHDENGAGQAAAMTCRQRWQDAGRTGVLLTPERPGTDFNDLAIELLQESAP